MTSRPFTVLGALLALGAGRWLALHRRSPAVRAWRPGAGVRRQAGPLSVRTAGDGGDAYVLLHGITASGEVFGAGWDSLCASGRVVVPDLLGFGRSMDEQRVDFSLSAHLDALDDMLSALDLNDAPLTVVGHSLGGLLALHWAARRQHVQAVLALCAPLYAGPDEADERIRAMGPLERLFALESRSAEAMCAWMCHHRSMAEWLSVALEPQWPVIVARYGVRHTWASYLGAMNGVIRRGGWESALATLEAGAVPVTLADGARDAVTVPGRSATLAAEWANVRAVVHPEADHEVPITHPGWCVELVRSSATVSSYHAR